jgi:hypothetical protein
VLRDDVIDKLESDEDLADIFEKLENTKQGGMLGPVLIREFNYLKDYFPPDESIKKETRDFLKFVEKHALRERGEEIPLTFSNGDHFNVTIAYIGQPPINLRSYLKRTGEELQEGKRVYILAANEKIQYAKKLTQKSKNSSVVEEYDEVEFIVPETDEREREKAYCVQLVPTK